MLSRRFGRGTALRSRADMAVMGIARRAPVLMRIAQRAPTAFWRGSG